MEPSESYLSIRTWLERGVWIMSYQDLLRILVALEKQERITAAEYQCLLLLAEGLNLVGKPII